MKQRANSELTYLKTYLRATMTQSRMNGLALMRVHYGLDIDLEDVVDMFARRHPRRLKLPNIVESD